MGARGLVIGVANAGGIIPPAWIAGLVEALEAGLDIISGMHARLSDIPELKAAAERTGRRLIDVRTPPPGIPVGSGKPRSGRRILTVGTDCALGKKYAALAITRGAEGQGRGRRLPRHGPDGDHDRRRRPADRRGGLRLHRRRRRDAEPGRRAEPHRRDRGAGLLLHPAYGAVSLGLLHGSQPTSSSSATSRAGRRSSAMPATPFRRSRR
jgi:uncharacterized NAD-dependent epimerase/dehydratase family protein